MMPEVKKVFDIFVALAKLYEKCRRQLSNGVDKFPVPGVYNEYCRVYNQSTD